MLILGAWTEYVVECHRYERGFRRLAWRERYHNIVVTAGKNLLLSRSFVTGVTGPAWYVALKAAGTVAASDTMGSHAGWAEQGTGIYSEATRPAFTPGAVAGGSVDNSAAKATFTCTATATVAGSFLTDNSTKGGTSGNLYGAGDFPAPRLVNNTDVLTVSSTVSV